MIVRKGDIIKKRDKYKPKAILILIDEMTEVMSDGNYRLVESIRSSLGSIARLGRAAGVHLCLATQRPSANVINSDLRNNIHMACLLGDFDSGASSLVFDKDISHLSKPEIKGRGFLQSGKEIYEFQSYWVDKDKNIKRRQGEIIKNNDDLNIIKQEDNSTNIIENKTLDIPMDRESMLANMEKLRKEAMLEKQKSVQGELDLPSQSIQIDSLQPIQPIDKNEAKIIAPIEDNENYQPIQFNQPISIEDSQYQPIKPIGENLLQKQPTNTKNITLNIKRIPEQNETGEQQIPLQHQPIQQTQPLHPINENNQKKTSKLKLNLK